LDKPNRFRGVFLQYFLHAGVQRSCSVGEERSRYTYGLSVLLRQRYIGNTWTLCVSTFLAPGLEFCVLLKIYNFFSTISPAANSTSVLHRRLISFPACAFGARVTFIYFCAGGTASKICVFESVILVEFGFRVQCNVIRLQAFRPGEENEGEFLVRFLGYRASKAGFISARVAFVTFEMDVF